MCNSKDWKPQKETINKPATYIAGFKNREQEKSLCRSKKYLQKILPTGKKQETFKKEYSMPSLEKLGEI